MSREAWGDPPEREPELCPLCGHASHRPDCELGEMQSKWQAAEAEVSRLRRLLREGSEPKAETEGLGGEAPQSPVASATRPKQSESESEAPSVQVVEPIAMNNVQLLAGSQILVEAIDDEFLKRGDWRPLAIGFAKSAMAIRDAMWRHSIAQASAAQQPAVEPADALKLLQEMVDMCALGDIDEDANDGLGWAGLVRDAKALIAASACQVPSDSPPWRVAEVWSSSTPGTKVAWMATHAQDQERVEKHHSFIRWLSPASPTAAPRVLGRIEPQPPKGIKYILGNESWLPAHARGLIRLHCEEWGHLGPMELNTEIKPNKAGFRVRCTEFIAPAGAHGFTEIDGVYYWTDMNWDMKKPGIDGRATRSQP